MPRLGFLAMVFNVISTYIRMTAGLFRLTRISDHYLSCRACAQQQFAN
jgi:hypothetical protein